MDNNNLNSVEATESITGYKKRDHWGFYKKIEFWHGLIALRVLNPMMQSGVWAILCTRVDTFIFRKYEFLIKFCINLYVSEQNI